MEVVFRTVKTKRKQHHTRHVRWALLDSYIGHEVPNAFCRILCVFHPMCLCSASCASVSLSGVGRVWRWPLPQSDKNRRYKVY